MVISDDYVNYYMKEFFVLFTFFIKYKVYPLFFILFFILKGSAFEGLTLITTTNKNGGLGNVDYTHLIDNEGNIVNEWIHDTNPASIAYLSRDSILFVPCAIELENRAPSGGRFKKMNWDGDIIWDYNLPDSICIPHHDIEVMPNGNILAICSEQKSNEEVVSKGRANTSNDELGMVFDMIVEIHPEENNQATILWEWRFWDRLIQDVDSSLDNYMSIEDNIQKLNINCELPGPLGVQLSDWNHCNAISYNSDLDQIAISSRRFSEIYIIDHSTNTLEAKSDVGGRYNKGGNFLYRWGNPQNHNSNLERKLFSPHSVNWVPKGYPGSGNILIFNNNYEDFNSAVIEVTPPIDIEGNYLIDDNIGSYGPDEFYWIYQNNFYSDIQSGVLRLANGNTLISVTSTPSLVFEIDSLGQKQWEYEGELVYIPRALKYLNNLTNYEKGDINQDNTINVQDVVLAINFVLNNEYDSTADFNSDQIIDVLDIVQLVNKILD